MFDKRKWQKAQQTHAENKTTTTRRNQRPIQREESRPIRRNRTEKEQEVFACQRARTCPVFQEPSRGS